MNIEKKLDFIFHHNLIIVEVLFGIVLLGVIFLTIRSFLRPESSEEGLNLGGLEAGLKKIIENHSGPSSSKVNQESAAEGDAIMEEMATQIERLKLQLMQKNEEIEQLKASGGSTGAPTPIATEASAKPLSSSGGGSSSELEEKVRDLEARLNEYSIIEDDIADLSFYKEETVRLQGEIDKLKAKLSEYEAGGPPPKFMAPPAITAEASPPQSSSAAPPPSTSAASPPPPPSASVASSTPLESPTPSSGSASENSLDDDIMAEFERAVAEQKALSSAQKIATGLNPKEEPLTESSIQAQTQDSTQTSTQTQTPIQAQPQSSNQNDASNSIAEEQRDLTKAEVQNLEASSSEPQELSEKSNVEIQSDHLNVVNLNNNEKNTEEDDINNNSINLDKMLSEVDGLTENIESDVANAIEQELDTEKLLKEATGMESDVVGVNSEYLDIPKKEGA